MNPTDPLVWVGASGGSSLDGEEALLQLSKAETTHAPQEHAPSPPKKGTEERRWAPEKSMSMG